MAKIFLTGKQGYLGSCVVSLLQQQNHVIHSYPNRLCSLEPNSISTDYIIHMAASLRHSPSDIYKTNVEGTRKLLDAIVCPTPIIFISSRAVYGNKSDLPPNEHAVINPEDAYGKSKLLGENSIMSSNNPYTILRPSSLYGVGVFNCGYGFLQRMISEIIYDNKLVVYGGNQLVDPLYVWDLATYIVKFCNQEFPNNSIYNVSGTALRLNSIVEILVNIINKYDVDYQIEHHELSSRVNSVLDSRKIMKASIWHQSMSTLEIIKELVRYKILLFSRLQNGEF